MHEVSFFTELYLVGNYLIVSIAIMFTGPTLVGNFEHDFESKYSSGD